MKLLIGQLLFIIKLFCQVMETQVYYDPNQIAIENNNLSYQFIFPINADVLNANPETYTPTSSNRYFISLFGPRYKQVNSSDIEYFDYHQGEDFNGTFTYNAVNFTNLNPAPVISMSSGFIYSKLDSTDVYLETIDQGRSVTIKSDSVFRNNANPSWGNIYINYRHLSSIKVGLNVNDSVQKGDTLGYIGSSGVTTLHHLHLSAAYRTNKLLNVHPMRLFTNNTATHIHKQLSNVSIQLLQAFTDSALFRLVFPFNEMVVKRITIRNEGFSRTFDYELQQQTGGNIDNHDAVPGLKLFPYGFNRYQTAFSRWKSDTISMPIQYPASNKRVNNQNVYQMYPINNNTVSHILDIMVNGLGNEFKTDSFEIKINDIYGNVVKGYYQPDITLPVNLINGSFVAHKTKLGYTISFETASEYNVQYIELLRAFSNTDLDLKWERVTLFSASNNAFGSSYNFHDELLDNKSNFLYYKLNIHNTDGSVESNDNLGPIKINHIENTNKKLTEFKTFPNPFNNVTQIQFSVPYQSTLSLKIYNILGQEVRTLFNNEDFIQCESLSFEWDAKNNRGAELSSGMYFAKLFILSENRSIVNKLILIK